ncbi:MAG: hypothetical protein KAI67_00210 [Candidatus Pacebacteria bacterium]|nr:hypothetical protein [Candidatus Paceibacterota bacterium]
MSNLFNGNDIILNKEKIVNALVSQKSSLTIDYAKIKYFAEAFIKEAGNKGSISKFNIGPIVRKTCSKCGILGNDPNIIEKIFKG